MFAQKLTRRRFLKWFGVGTAAAVIAGKIGAETVSADAVSVASPSENWLNVGKAIPDGIEEGLRRNPPMIDVDGVYQLPACDDLSVTVNYWPPDRVRDDDGNEYLVPRPDKIMDGSATMRWSALTEADLQMVWDACLTQREITVSVLAKHHARPAIGYCRMHGGGKRWLLTGRFTDAETSGENDIAMQMALTKAPIIVAAEPEWMAAWAESPELRGAI